MPGSAGESASVESGVGLTALMVAAARAIETYRGDALARDRFAEHFVRASSASAHWPVHPDDVEGGAAHPLWGRFARYFGLRTRVLDDELARSVAEGARQVVLLGAGLDSRAFRLSWPPGTVVYELDRPGVLAFKQDVLTAVGAVPTAQRRTILADLGADWVPELLAAGYDPAVPTAWLAEGLLLYLPAAVEVEVIAAIDRLAAPGSSLAYEIKPGIEPRVVYDLPLYAAARDQLGVDLLGLFDGDPRPDSAAGLSDRGWHVAVCDPFEFTRQHGRGPLPEPDDALATNRWVFARRPATARPPS